MAMANETEVQQLITDGAGALRRGDKATARTLLTQALEHDDRNEQVWLWLSGAVDTPEEQRICLENVLVLNPGSDIARRGLDLLNQQAPPPAPAPLAPLPPPAAPAPPEPVAGPPVPSEPGPKQTRGTAPLDTHSVDAPAPSAAAPPAEWPAVPPDGRIAGPTPAADDSILPSWMDQAGDEVPVAPPAPAPPPLPSSGSIFGSAAGTTDTVLPGWMDQPAPAAPARPTAPEPPPPPMVGGAAANWANVVSSLRSPDAVPAPADAETPPPPPGYGGPPGYAPAPPEGQPAWAAAAPPPGAWPPADHPSAAPDPALSGIQPFQVPTEMGSPAPSTAGDMFGGLFNQPAPPAYPPPGSAAPPGYEGYGSAPVPPGYEGYGSAPAPTGYEGYGATAPGYDPNSYAGGDASYPLPTGTDSYQFGTNEPYGQGEYTSPDGPGLLANLAGYDVAGHTYGSSPMLIGRPPLNRTPVTPTIPCPNCGELVTESALSCPRCNYRFYAPCPNCGEYIDTGDPSASGKDVCPRCGTPVDKLALGRAGVRVAGRGANPREAMLAATRAQKAQKDLAAPVPAAEAKPRRRSSPAAVLLLLILLVILGLLLAYAFDIAPVSTIIHSVLPAGATPVPTP